MFIPLLFVRIENFIDNFLEVLFQLNIWTIQLQKTVWETGNSINTGKLSHKYKQQVLENSDWTLICYA